MPSPLKETVSSVVLDRQGIICAAEFKGIDFDNQHGWPQGSVVGQPFVSIHAMHAISISEISKGVQRVCQGKAAQFRYRFDIREPSNDGSCEYELVAGHDTADADNIVVTYEPLTPHSEGTSAETALIEKNRKSLIAHTNIHAALFDHVPIGIIYQNNQGGIELVNPAAEKVLGASKDKIISIARGKVPWECVDRFGIRMPLDNIPSLRTLATGEPQRDVHIGIKRSSGDTSWITVNSELVVDSESGEQTGVLTTFVDITVERKAQEALKAQTERTQMAVESAEMGVWDWIPGEKSMLWDKKLFQLYGYPNDGVVSSMEAWKKAIHPEDVDRVLREAEDMTTSGKQKNIDYRVVWPNGRIRNLRSQARLVKDAEGDVTRIIGVTHDISNEVMAEKKLWELAYTDSLTGAYSRAGLNFRLSRTVARALKRDASFSVIMFGLSRFKDINDNYGLSVGDKILCEVARRTQELIGIEDTVARVGGDEFTLVLEDVAKDADIDAFVTRFREAVLKPIYLNEGLLVNLDAALGVSVFPDDGCDAAILQTNSGMAMQEDRLHEHRSFRRYTPAMSEEVSRKFNLKYQLFSAVKDEEFQLYYQPIIDLHCNKIIGCEALIRWKDNHGNFVSPMEFIPVVEESGLICELGRWINLTAVKQWKMWQQLVPDLKYISVNVSPRQLETSTFVDDLLRMVTEYNIKPQNLQLEITEGTFLQESENSDGALHKLANHGFRLAIDDFGTGYSSLAYLKRLSVDVIKIDRSFIKDIETDSSDRDIVSAILAMNKKLGFKTLVEGVETPKQNQIVHDLGCDSAQGYLYGKPTFADEFAETYISSRPQH
ncbi:MAG: EAL domain-containing protein [Agarilytica sp.]